ncbi:MAG: DUF2914 domain-containing protein [Deltaproteobacteria bacterium]|nr:DUF2914 domain-containing protein [Deltaproteobacteria bacterium]
MKALIAACLTVFLLLSGAGRAAEGPGVQDGSGPEPPVLTKAVMCEEIRNGAPYRPAVVFPAETEQVVCFSRFDSIHEETWVYHNWFHRDRLSRRIRLELHPPKWGTFSRIQLRENDRGPWRVEISDQDGRTIEILRFSITD